MKYILGVDDAGRGPIIGSMFVAGVLAKKEDSPNLKALGVKDSKLLSPHQRDVLAAEIKKAAVNYKAVEITPLEIDTKEDHGLNLNDLEAIKMAEAINSLTEKLGKADEVEIFIDCPSVNTEAWKGYLLKHIKNIQGKKFVVEHKADYNYPVCSAASIIAKTSRDASIEEIKKKIKADFGSGYPADPITQEFLRERGVRYLKYHIIRESWQTWKDLKKKAGQSKLF